jgi:two-component system, chemotaxis family, response regulator PixG
VSHRSLSIVVIDDSPTVCTILETVLTREGHQVQLFLDPVPALRSFLFHREIPPPDLFFVDLSLPHVSGYELIKLFRKHPAFRRIPIIVISRIDNAVVRLNVRLAGANAYLTKPFQVQDVLTLAQFFAAFPNSTTHEK